MSSFRECSIDGCRKKLLARGYCDTHYWRLRKHGDPNVLIGNGGQNHYRWSGNNISYKGAHRRLQRLRGPARSHACEHCGEGASQWAYTHDCPDEKRNEKGHPYSADPARYVPLCASCHTKFDRWSDDARARAS